jgi:hypothetical protein
MAETRMAKRNFLSIFFSSVYALPGERTDCGRAKVDDGFLPRLPAGNPAIYRSCGPTDRRLCVPASRRVCQITVDVVAGYVLSGSLNGCATRLRESLNPAILATGEDLV